MILPTSLIASSALVLTLSAASAASDAPAWNVRNAAEKLIDQHSLRLPAGDWFMQSNGRLIQWEKPAITFSKSTVYFWEAEVISRRWREYKQGKWGPWTNASPNYDHWSVGKLAISVPASGGATASFTSGKENFVGYIPPGAAYVAQVR